MKNSLANTFPELAEQWHPTKNGELRPTDIVAGSKRKIWWKCDIGFDHEWQAQPYSRTKRGDGCPFCSKSPRASSTNNLALNYPEVAKKWHPTKNGELFPHNVTSNSTKKVWWFCKDGHYYQHSPNQMTSKNIKCPYCSGYRIGQGNSLLDKFPEVASEWDYEKNADIRPDAVSPKSHKKYWFKCKFFHSYRATLSDRTNGSGCSQCTYQTSQAELRIFSEMKYLFQDTKHRHKYKKVEFDVFVPSLNLAIEYDGAYWHKEKQKKDLAKNHFCELNGIKLVRVRESPLDKLTKNDIILRKGKLNKLILNKIIKNLFYGVCSLEFEDSRIQNYLEANEFQNEIFFKEVETYRPLPAKEKNIVSTNPDLLEVWDYEKNAPLTPEHFTGGSNTEVHWKCRKGHSYKKTIVARRDSVGCPICYRNRGTKLSGTPTIHDKRQMRLI